MGLNDMSSIYTVKVYRENYKESSRKAFLYQQVSANFYIMYIIIYNILHINGNVFPHTRMVYNL